MSEIKIILDEGSSENAMRMIAELLDCSVKYFQGQVILKPGSSIIQTLKSINSNQAELPLDEIK